jgi:hypothetical protein
MNKGLWVLAGLLIFIVLEKVFTSVPGNMDIQNTISDLNVKQENQYILNNNVKDLVNGYANGHCASVKATSNIHEKGLLITPIKSTSKKVSTSIPVCSLSIRLHYRQSRIMYVAIHIFRLVIWLFYDTVMCWDLSMPHDT